jgi:hypothetical protein
VPPLPLLLCRILFFQIKQDQFQKFLRDQLFSCEIRNQNRSPSICARCTSAESAYFVFLVIIKFSIDFIDFTEQSQYWKFCYPGSARPPSLVDFPGMRRYSTPLLWKTQKKSSDDPGSFRIRSSLPCGFPRLSNCTAMRPAPGVAEPSRDGNSEVAETLTSQRLCSELFFRFQGKRLNLSFS